jgi:NADPH:quinone reductase-like Zn-dependent oxidoreductase
MRAIVCTDYGPPDVLQLRDVLKPVPKDNEVLVRIRAIARQEDRADVGAHCRAEPRALVARSEGLDITGIVSRGRAAVYTPAVLRLRDQSRASRERIARRNPWRTV